MIRIAVVTGSTRPNRKSEAVARWVLEVAARRGDAEFALVDIAAQDLPLLDEPVPPSRGDYRHAHTRRWAAVVDGFDGFVFVSPEYNHSVPAALKNALDYLYAEWNDKAAGLVTYGGAGGVRAAEHLRQILGELQVATVRQQVTLALATDWESGRFRPDASRHEPRLEGMLDQLLRWTGALRTVRAVRPPRPRDGRSAPPPRRPGARWTARARR